MHRSGFCFAQVRRAGSVPITVKVPQRTGAGLASGHVSGQSPAAIAGCWPKEGKLWPAVNQTLTFFRTPVASGDEVAVFHR